MHLMTRLRQFRTDDNGAITVDWVVLTAAIVVLGVVVGVAVGTGAFEVAESIEAKLIEAAQQ